MKVLVDTSIWSLALRRRIGAPHAFANELAALVNENRVTIIGPIRQELLSGIKIQSQFEKLRDDLHAFPDMAITMSEYEQAALFFNRCRERGIQGSNTDFLICAAAVRNKLSIFTTDHDFKHFAAILPIVLHEPRPT